MTLNAKPPCKCCSSVRAYIEAHLDPDSTLTADDDASEVVAGLDDVFRSEGGAGVTVEQMSEYLHTLTH